MADLRAFNTSNLAINKSIAEFKLFAVGDHYDMFFQVLREYLAATRSCVNSGYRSPQANTSREEKRAILEDACQDVKIMLENEPPSRDQSLKNIYSGIKAELDLIDRDVDAKLDKKKKAKGAQI